MLFCFPLSAQVGARLAFCCLALSLNPSSVLGHSLLPIRFNSPINPFPPSPSSLFSPYSRTSYCSVPAVLSTPSSSKITPFSPCLCDAEDAEDSPWISLDWIIYDGELKVHGDSELCREDAPHDLVVDDGELELVVESEFQGTSFLQVDVDVVGGLGDVATGL